jgi:hypothetical protein
MTNAVIIAQQGSNNTTLFKPTVLLVMTHNVTGKKYFCKTTVLKRLSWYKGSGVHWRRHLAKYGSDITVDVLGLYFNKNYCVNSALEFSKTNNIVESDEWLNHVAEDGLTGWPCGKENYAFGKVNQYKDKKRPDISVRFTGSNNPMWGKPSPMRGIAKPKGKDSPLYGRKRPEGGGKKPHSVIKIDADGVETRYDSVSDAARVLGVSRSCIHTVCTGKNKTGAGYKWRYAND